jgi:ribosomal protein S18 acetylase RimI-like enzyme
MAPSTILDLRQTSVRQIETLLEEETRRWRDELHWDYRNAAELIKRFVEARSLAGFVAMENGQAVGYSFYVLEDQKGLIGGLYVMPRYLQLGISRRLLDELLFSLRAIPHLQRIEAQLMPFGSSMDEALAAHGFRLYMRQFMSLGLPAGVAPKEESASSLLLERWSDRFMEPCAHLIHLAYTDHVDSQINDQYQSAAGALRFLKNIILLPGCGQFLPGASFLAHAPGGYDPVGAVLSSEVAPHVGHVTQLCVRPGFQGQGFGRSLTLAAIQALREMKFSELTLTVTSANAPAVRLYEKLGFRSVKMFSAGVWPA